AEHGKLAQIEVGGEGRRIASSESLVQIEGWFCQRSLEPLGEIGLKDVSRQDVLSHSGDRIEICSVSKGGAESDSLRAFHAEHGERWWRGTLRKRYRRPGAPPGLGGCRAR